MGELFVINLPY